MKFQEAKSKDGSTTTDEPLLLTSQKSEGNQGWYLKNDDKNNEINGSLYEAWESECSNDSVFH